VRLKRRGTGKPGGCLFESWLGSAAPLSPSPLALSRSGCGLALRVSTSCSWLQCFRLARRESSRPHVERERQWDSEAGRCCSSPGETRVRAVGSPEHSLHVPPGRLRGVRCREPNSRIGQTGNKKAAKTLEKMEILETKRYIVSYFIY
jgi:hypothetical protein